MTTESKPGTRTGLSPLLGAVGAGAVAVLVLVLAASVTAGRPAVVGAATGRSPDAGRVRPGRRRRGRRRPPDARGLAARGPPDLPPPAPRPGALRVVGHHRAGVTDETLSRAGSRPVISVTLLWLVARWSLATRQRIPLYDTPAAERVAPITPGVSDDRPDC